MKACKEYLDEQGVQPCAHSAKENELFISVSASCKALKYRFDIYTPSEPTPMIRTLELLGRMGDGWEIAEDQHFQFVDEATIRCENKSMVPVPSSPTILGEETLKGSMFSWYEERTKAVQHGIMFYWWMMRKQLRNFMRR